MSFDFAIYRYTLPSIQSDEQYGFQSHTPHRKRHFDLTGVCLHLHLTGPVQLTQNNSPPHTASVPSPRAFLLPWNEFQIWLEYYQYMTFYANRTDDTAKIFRDKIMLKMTPERTAKFPVLVWIVLLFPLFFPLGDTLTDEKKVEEYAIFFAHREARMVKESLEELVAELRLEAENDIDLERERC